MPAKKRTIIEETLPDGATAANQTGIPESVIWETEEDTILARIKAQYGETASVKTKVYKIMTGKSEPVFVFSSTDNVDEEILQETYGGGKYALRIFIDGLLKHTHYMEVADKPISKSNPANDNGISASERMMRDQMDRTYQLLLTVLGRPNPIAPQTPLAELVTAANMIKGNNGGPSLDTMITLFTKGLDLGSGKSGDMDWKTALVQTIKDIAPVVTTAIAQAKGVPMQQTTLENGAMLPGDDVIKKGITFIKGKILQGLPVGLALDWVVANANDHAPFIQMALTKSFEEIVRVDPELANEPYNSWVRQFLEGLKEHFKENIALEESDDQEAS